VTRPQLDARESRSYRSLLSTMTSVPCLRTDEGEPLDVDDGEVGGKPYLAMITPTAITITRPMQTAIRILIGCTRSFPRVLIACMAGAEYPRSLCQASAPGE